MVDIQLHLGDCLEWLPTLQAQSVDCVLVDLPYYGIVTHGWDNQWKNRNEYLDWVISLAHEWKRITKDNSSIFVFCDEKMESYIQVRLDEIFLLLNKIVWFKPNNLPQKNAHLLRTFAPMTERALFYTTQYDPTGWETVKLDMNNFVPLREYFRQYQEALGLSIHEINAKLGHRKAEHAFYWNSTQWDLPTPDTYEDLGRLQIKNEFIRRDYEFIRRDYEDLRRDYEDLRRPFNADSQTWDVISWPIISQSENTEHPTTKPLGLYRRIISVITNPGQIILDCCMGSGTCSVAAIQTGRRFIGCEIDPGYFAIAEKRIAQAQLQPPLFTVDTPKPKQDALW